MVPVPGGTQCCAKLVYLFTSFPGLTAKVIDQTYSMSDVYGAFYEFSSLLKSKVGSPMLYYGGLPPTGYVNSFRIAQMIPLRVRIIMK
ncbi:hypothetical protein BHM03_00017418, partial [Ensete ventricosum]